MIQHITMLHLRVVKINISRRNIMSVYDGQCTTCFLGRLVAQVGWVGLQVGTYLALFCIHKMNQINSHSGSLETR